MVSNRVEQARATAASIHNANRIKMPAGTSYETPEEKDPWKQNKPIGQRDKQDMMAAGIARHRLTDFTPATGDLASNDSGFDPGGDFGGDFGSSDV